MEAEWYLIAETDNVDHWRTIDACRCSLEVDFHKPLSRVSFDEPATVREIIANMRYHRHWYRNDGVLGYMWVNKNTWEPFPFPYEFFE